MGRFERIASNRIYQQIVDQISSMIKERILRPGDRLPAERQLAEEFGVSRAAVREALSALTLMGLLEVRQGDGTYIRTASEEGLITPMALLVTFERDQALGIELLEIRVALEAEAAFLAALRREPDDLALMETALQEMEARASDEQARAQADWRFHLAIAGATGNGLMLQTVRSLSDALREAIAHYRQRLLRIPGQDDALLLEHRSIFEAIRDGKAELAQQRMRSHIERVKNTLYDDALPQEA